LNQPSLLKIMLLVPPAEGGMAEHVLSLLRGLDRGRFQLSLACSTRGALANQAKALGVPCYLLPISSIRNPVKSVWATMQFARLVGKEQPDIIHAHSWSAGMAAALALRFIRPHPALLCTLHSFPAQSIFSRGTVNRVADACDKIISVSRSLTELLNKSQLEKTVIIPNGIAFPESYPSPAEAREKLGLPQDTAIVGAVARLAPQKGIEVLLEAASRLDKVHFAVLGEGPLRNRLESRRCELSLGDRFHLLGHRLDAKVLLPAFDMLAIPSLSEGAPLIALEAMAAGCPIIASRLDSLEEIITEGKTGLLVNPADPKALADALGYLFANPHIAASFSRTGTEHCRQKYTLEQMTQQVMTLYDNLVAAR